MPVLRLCFLLAALLVVASPAASAETVRTIDWTTLLSPEETALRERLPAIQVRIRSWPPDQQKALPRIASEFRLRQLVAQGEVKPDQLKPMQRELLDHPPSKTYPEAAAVWLEMEDLKRKIDAFKNATNPTLAGQRVHMSGYLLPLEFDGGEVSEFLLVPFVGSCIHVPPPPPNQIVHVKLAGRYAADHVFAPVTVTGTMTVGQGQANLFLTDGTALVDHGYRIDAEMVSAAKTE